MPISTTGDKNKEQTGTFPKAGDIIVFSLLFCLLVLGVAYLVFWSLNRHQIQYDLAKPSVIREFTLFGKGQKATVSPKGLSIKTKRPCGLLSPRLGNEPRSREQLSWSKYPYVKIVLEKSSADKHLLFIWNPQFNLKRSHIFPFIVPSGTKEIVIDTQSSEPWKGRFPLKGPIGQFGFQFHQDIEIKSISLLSSLSLSDLNKVILDEYLSAETILPFSINNLCGIFVLGRPLITYFGLTLCLLAFICIFHRSRFTKTLLVAGGLLPYILLDFQYNYSLLDHAKYSYRRSAWHDSLYNERQSRFGHDFALLAHEFEKKIPVGSKVFFPREKYSKVRGETNWIAFHYYPRYLSVDLENADYIFFYHPKRYLYRPEQNIVSSLKNGKNAARVRLIYDSGMNVKLFEVIHD
ncbi:MAG: hypothetical protein JRJ14_07645 [Deltaproteobacteria bacterium]|nr:hypothetical protein [Deltaproteobacteria bacterium]